MPSTLRDPAPSTAVIDPAPILSDLPSIDVLSPVETTSGPPDQPTPDELGESEFAGFAKAIGIGTAIGIPVFALIVFAILVFAAPAMSVTVAAGVSVWVAVWIGVFLGGTFTVGRWSHRNMH